MASETTTAMAGFGAASRWASDLAGEIDRGVRTHALLYAYAGFIVAAAIAESFYLGVPLDMQMVIIFGGPALLVLGAMLLVLVLVENYRLWKSGHEGSALAALGARLGCDLFAPRRIANAIHASAFMTIFMIGYTFIKKAIPTMNPFDWDEAFMEIDRLVHFGWHPYELLQPLLGQPFITFVLNLNYNIWFVAMFGCWFWQGFSKRDSNLRLQFLLAFAITWSVGCNFFGTIFASGGPCFYGNLVPGDNPFTPLMAYLNEVNQTWPIWALATQDELWSSYATGEGIVNGISAMPSMHIASSMLFTLLGFAANRTLGWIFATFTFLIFLGSIHLGWHYAIDGYFGAALAVVCWWLTGRLIAWHRRTIDLPAD